MHRNFVRLYGPLFTRGGDIGKFKRRETQQPFAHRTHPVGKAAGVPVRIGLGAFIVNLPVAALHSVRQRRRMQSLEIRVAEKIDGKRKRIAHLHVVGVEERPGAEIFPRHSRKLNQRGRQHCKKSHLPPRTL